MTEDPINGGVWVACSERLPEKRHADGYGDVIGRSDDGDVRVINYRSLHLVPYYCHWLDTTQPIMTVAEHEAAINQLTKQRDVAIKHIAEWYVAIETIGTGWDDWDEYFKDASCRDNSLLEIRELLVEAIAKARKELDSND